VKNRRLERINNLIRIELGKLILLQLRDPRLAQVVSVTAVDVSPDMGSAKVYVSVLGAEEVKGQTLVGLQSAAGFLRRELGRRVTLRVTPELRFLLDNSLEQEAKVLALLQEVAPSAAPDPSHSPQPSS
jgi:ribosome-binding factor A